MLISDEEAGCAVGISAQAATDFLAQHSVQRQVLCYAKPVCQLHAA